MSPSLLLREARRSAGMTQVELAERLGVTQGAIAQLEQSGSNPTFARLDAALRATGNRLVLTIEDHQPNVDETLIARNLRISPAERLPAFEDAHRELEELRDLMSGGG